MRADFFYSSVFGRSLLKAIQVSGSFKLGAKFLRSRASKGMIPGYIKRNDIDMMPFKGQTYDSFASFFARKKEAPPYVSDPDVLISPCDGLLSIYTVTADSEIPMKGSVYSISDLVPDPELAASFQNGLCLVIRLEASDYHQFFRVVDGRLVKTVFIPGQLHSVQPIAHKHVPVFRLNRRWCSILETEHFGKAVQVEIGAMMVGGVSFALKSGRFRRGDELGNFELAGSTVILLLDSSVRDSLVIPGELVPALDGEKEIRVQMGAALGKLKKH